MVSAAGRSREERWSLAGATALVTGGSKGIGYIIKLLAHNLDG
jgi:tropinone reductase I